MQHFTGFEYLLIDAANQFGLDKELFETRIERMRENLADLESLVEQADNKPLFIKAVAAIRKAQQGIPTGHLVGFDGVCSGMQVMSALTGCIAGATATGMVDPTKRADAYTAVTKAINQILAQWTETSVEVKRSNAKQAVMTSLYGSYAEPVKIFGKDTPELAAFYAAMEQVCPGAWELLQVLLASWRPTAMYHAWQLPDGFQAKVKSMVKIDQDNPLSRIEVDELDHTTFTYTYYVNQPQEKNKSNAANVVHSVDAYVMRSIHRRCNYDKDIVSHAHTLLMRARNEWLAGRQEAEEATGQVKYYLDLWKATGIADVVILPILTEENVLQLPFELIAKLLTITEKMLSYRPFPVVTIHDEFKCHANNMNHLREQYVEIMADLAEGKLLDFILGSIYGEEVTYNKLSNDLGKHIRNSNYALS